MKIRTSTELDYEDVLLLPKRSTLSSRSEVVLERDFKTPWGVMRFCPIIAANMYNTGSIEMGLKLAQYNFGVAYHKFIDKNEFCHSNEISSSNFFTIGMKESELTDIQDFFNNKVCGWLPQNICVDVANGYQESFVDFIKLVRKELPNAFIMAGNVVTGSMTEQLIIAGANVVKVGIGSGGMCTTRLVAGVGRAQFSAVLECADAAHGLNGYICADGGIKTIGDISKAFGANADMVMVGSLFMGYEENDGDWIYKCDEKSLIDIKHQLKCFGMSSKEAQEQFNGGIADYRASEGDCYYIDYKGSITSICKEIRGGIASACTYIGARSIKDIGKCAEFTIVNRRK